ncbi:MAG: aminoglycoside phosphotransferase family protein [Hamadaea sp.]|nr:aminoglycoside phosphotransferase family protein [Hamadaea sp.]NUR52234.1 aminoglycoside phosphotransferase family protein [Hamadaea sp.]NUT06188.1 aminoglycoside phosphotransferase family protein [Hamadaea sp.]
MPRTVTLALLDDDGALLGALPPVEVEVPWWQETASVIAAVQERFGVEVAVLRLLHAPEHFPGGEVTYLAQTGPLSAGELPATRAIDVDLNDHPLRPDYAKPGGPDRSLDWAAEQLHELEFGPIGAATQMRTWNLSAIWRLEAAAGTVWLKQVPAFFAHEPVVLRWLAAEGFGLSVPIQLATDGSRMLLADLPGVDLYAAGLGVRASIAATHHHIQVEAAAQATRLIGLGVPDLRGPRLTEVVTRVTQWYAESDPALEALVAGLSDRWAAIDACGLPDTLVHGDLHPGNARGDEVHQAVLDWGDSFVGHPGFDILRLTERVSEPEGAALIEAWAARWQHAVPGCDPVKAIDLLRPVAALRNAATYARFLANIEPSEHPYHAGDVPFWLHQAALAA